MPSEITLGLAFTDEELKRAILLMRDDPEHFHERCRDEIVKPALSRINMTFGQDNDPDWLAFFLEYALSKTHEKILAETTEKKHEDRVRWITPEEGC